MRSLVMYYSNGGTTKETADRLKEKADLEDLELDVMDIKSKKSVSLKEYDRIYIGTGVYGGGLPMEISKLVREHADELRGMDIIIFIHALGSEDGYEQMAAKAMQPLGAKEYRLFYLGGKAEMAKQNFFIKMLMKKLVKKKKLDMEYPNTLLKDVIAELVATV